MVCLTYQILSYRDSQSGKSRNIQDTLEQREKSFVFQAKSRCLTDVDVATVRVQQVGGSVVVVADFKPKRHVLALRLETVYKSSVILAGNEKLLGPLQVVHAGPWSGDRQTDDKILVALGEC